LGDVGIEQRAVHAVGLDDGLGGYRGELKVSES
jgi:hypothetical protein